MLDPRSTSSLAADFLGIKFQKHHGVLAVMAIDPVTSDLSWFYLVGNGTKPMKYYALDDSMAGIIDNIFSNQKFGKLSNMQPLDNTHPTKRVNLGDASIIDIFGNVHSVWEFKTRLFLSSEAAKPSIFSNYPGIKGSLFLEKEQAFRFFDEQRRHVDIYLSKHVPPIRQVTHERFANLKRCGDFLSLGNNCYQVTMNTVNHVLKMLSRR